MKYETLDRVRRELESSEVPTTAAELQGRLGLPCEVVYQALVHLHDMGLAFIRPSKQKHTARRYDWIAA